MIYRHCCCENSQYFGDISVKPTDFNLGQVVCRYCRCSPQSAAALQFVAVGILRLSEIQRSVPPIGTEIMKTLVAALCLCANLPVNIVGCPGWEWAWGLWPFILAWLCNREKDSDGCLMCIDKYFQMVLAAAGATSTMAHRVRVRLGLGLALGLGFVDIVDMLPAANCGRHLRLQPTVTQYFKPLLLMNHNVPVLSQISRSFLTFTKPVLCSDYTCTTKYYQRDEVL